MLHFLNDNKSIFFLFGLAAGIIIILIYDYRKMYEMVEKEVEQAQFRADEAEQRKNDLVVYLAHDLKTPLTSVMGYLQLLQDEPDLQEETRQHYIRVVARKTERLEDLINEFFEITRYNLTHITLEKSEINLTR
ncbi:MAG: vancomycin resistance histidine kinase VanS, partial [Eubacterium sp.]|nr:vancomycin resistance histidine kinase VanS [Eubacterium sp.]